MLVVLQINGLLDIGLPAAAYLTQYLKPLLKSFHRVKIRLNKGDLKLLVLAAHTVLVNRGRLRARCELVVDLLN